MVVGADAVLCGGGAILFGNECEYHTFYAVGYAQRTDGTVHQSDYFPMGNQTALESVCRCDTHQTVVGAADAGTDVRYNTAARMACAERVFHVGIGFLYHNGFCFGDARYCR